MTDARTTDRGNPELLRKEIDQGRTGDKIGVADPAASPLGTDAEAGGNPPSKREVAHARRVEVRPQPSPRGRTPALAIVVIGTVASVLIGAALTAL